MSNVLVIGANGYLGRHLCKVLSKLDIKFIPAGRNKISVDGYSNYISLDLENQSSIDNAPLDVDLIFMFAGLTGTKTDEESTRKFKSINEQGLVNLLDCIVKKKSTAKIIFPSTRLVYKGVKDKFLNEDDLKETKTPYALSKLNGEAILANYNNSFGVKYTTFRICVPFGNEFDEDYSYGTIGFFLSKAKKGENITLYGDGSLKRTFTHVNDIVRIIVESSIDDRSNNKIYNIGGKDNLSLKNLASIIAKKFNVGLDFIPFPKEALKVESGDTMFSDKKLKDDFEINYKYSISDFL